MNILVPVDGSAYTKRALAYLATHDEWLSTHHRYTLLTVVPTVPPRAAAVIAKDVLRDYYAAQVETVFKPIRSFFVKRGLDAEYQSKLGHAAEQIVAVAAKGKHDLILMGSHGHGSLGSLVLGSVASKVLAQSKTPLLLIR